MDKFKKLKNVKFLGDVRDLDLFKSIINQSKSDGRNITGLVNNAGERQRIKFNNIDKKSYSIYLKLSLQSSKL